MPDFMPYTTEKSMIFQVVESWANGERGVALQALWDLLDGRRVSDMAPIASTTLDHPPYETVLKRRKHVEEDWWGHQPTSVPGQWSDVQPGYAVKPTTGFWRHWYGNAEGVFRETMIRALCISLGIQRETEAETEEYRGKPRPSANNGGSQHWPISILWKCPCPWYEGWIEFKESGRRWGVVGPKQGHVTVVLSTPSHGVKLYDTPIRPPNSPPVVNDPYGSYAVNPRSPSGPEGLWVVSHALNTLVPTPEPTSSPPETWAPPTLGKPVVSTGPVVCVSPAVGDGGVAPSGIPYTP